MRQPSLSKWQVKDETIGLLFFSLMIDELLFDYTIDTFKIPALNTKSICDELDETILEIERGCLAPAVVRSVVDELSSSIEKDPVLKEILNHHYAAYLSLLHQGSIEDLKNRVRYLKNKIQGCYFDVCKKLLVEKLREGKEKESITRLTRIYITELIAMGYSPAYLYFENNLFFFSGKYPKKIDSPDLIHDYFKCLGGESKKWNVLIRVSKNFKFIDKFVPHIGIEIVDTCPPFKFSRTSDQFKEITGKNEQYPLYFIVKDIEALDSFRARELAEQKIVLIHSLVKYHVHRKDLWWNRIFMIFSEERDCFSVCGPPTAPHLKRPDGLPEKLSDLVKETVRALTESKLDGYSWHRLVRALEMHRSAIVSQTLENQLLNFWSAIEVLFPPSAGEGSSRIEQIIDDIIPFITKAYTAKLMTYLLKSIETCGGDEARKIVSEVDVGDNLIDKLTAIICMDDKKDVREKLYKLFLNNPLLINRIDYLHTKLCSGDAILKMLNAHITRVSWHLRRIYRIRNIIVHSGSTSRHIGILVENLHTYLDRVFELIHEKVSIATQDISIEEIAIEYKLDCQNHLSILENNKKLTCLTENYKKLLYGNA